MGIQSLGLVDTTPQPQTSFTDEYDSATLDTVEAEYKDKQTEFDEIQYENIDFADTEEGNAQEEATEAAAEQALIQKTSQELFDKNASELNEKEKMLLEETLLKAAGEDKKFDDKEWEDFQSVFASDAIDGDETNDAKEKEDALKNHISQELYGKDFDKLSDTEKGEVENTITDAAKIDGETGLSDAEINQVKALLANIDKNDPTTDTPEERVAVVDTGISEITDANEESKDGGESDGEGSVTGKMLDEQMKALEKNLAGNS